MLTFPYSLSFSKSLTFQGPRAHASKAGMEIALQSIVRTLQSICFAPTRLLAASLASPPISVRWRG